MHILSLIKETLPLKTTYNITRDFTKQIFNHEF